MPVSGSCGLTSRGWRTRSEFPTRVKASASRPTCSMVCPRPSWIQPSFPGWSLWELSLPAPTWLCQVPAGLRGRVSGPSKIPLACSPRLLSSARLLGPPYFIENPVSTISSYWRKPDHTFDPWQYNALDPASSYTKKTCLWVGVGSRCPALKLTTRCPSTRTTSTTWAVLPRTPTQVRTSAV